MNGWTDGCTTRGRKREWMVGDEKVDGLSIDGWRVWWMMGVLIDGWKDRQAGKGEWALGKEGRVGEEGRTWA